MHIRDHLARVPDHLKSAQEFKTLRVLIREQHIDTATQLRRYIKSEISSLSASLKSLGESSTNNRKRAEISKKLEFLHTVQEKILQYL
ncbi:hypothetical protein HY490_00800 [Candidatus Woesearchaeota archaeon]|nr:hypothetical protein [Candidatus Woesearchaeota archaeon]